MKSMVISKVIAINETITGTNSATGNPINVGYAESFSAHCLISGTTPDVKVEIQVSDSQLGDSNLIGTADDGGTWITPTNGIIKSSVSANFAEGFSIPVCKWIRTVVTGVNSNNSADVKLTIMYQ